MSGLESLAWVFSGVLTVVFLATGFVKAYRFEAAKKRFAWVNDLPQGLVQIIGLMEIVFAIGLILPVATGFYPWLTSVAANFLMMLMMTSIGFHLWRKETDEAVLNGLILLIVGLVAWVRLPLLASLGF